MKNARIFPWGGLFLAISSQAQAQPQQDCSKTLKSDFVFSSQSHLVQWAYLNQIDRMVKSDERDSGSQSFGVGEVNIGANQTRTRNFIDTFNSTTKLNLNSSQQSDVITSTLSDNAREVYKTCIAGNSGHVLAAWITNTSNKDLINVKVKYVSRGLGQPPSLTATFEGLSGGTFLNNQPSEQPVDSNGVNFTFSRTSGSNFSVNIVGMTEKKERTSENVFSLWPADIVVKAELIERSSDDKDVLINGKSTLIMDGFQKGSDHAEKRFSFSSRPHYQMIAESISPIFEYNTSCGFKPKYSAGPKVNEAGMVMEGEMFATTSISCNQVITGHIKWKEYRLLVLVDGKPANPLQ